jgi:sortase A
VTITQQAPGQASEPAPARDPAALETPSVPSRELARGPGQPRKTDISAVASVAVPVALCVLALWFLLFATVLTGFRERGSQARLYERFRSELALETVPISAPIGVGTPVAMISAPAAGLHSVVVVEGTTAKQLTGGPGHRSDTPLPGQVGISVIYGRSLTFGGPFGHLTDLKAGDPITVTTGQGVFDYKVADIRRPGDPVPAAPGPNGSRLTLVTSTSQGWRSGWAPSETMYVDANLSGGKVSAVPASLPTSVSKASTAMQGDPGALVGLIFWLEALGLATGAVIWAWLRWGRLQTWLVGGPLLAAILWAASDQVALLLPNLF